MSPSRPPPGTPGTTRRLRRDRSSCRPIMARWRSGTSVCGHSAAPRRTERRDTAQLLLLLLLLPLLLTERGRHRAFAATPLALRLEPRARGPGRLGRGPLAPVGRDAV